MGEIEVEVNDQDITTLIEEGKLSIPLSEGIIDKEPAITLSYEGDAAIIK